MYDCLRLDYKTFEGEGGGKKFGLSSVLLPIDVMMRGAEEVKVDMEKFMNEKGVNFLGVMSMVVGEETETETKTKTKRTMLLVGEDEDVTRCNNFLLEQGEFEQGEKINNGFTFLHQRNVKMSRKQVAPLLMSCFKK